MSFKRWAWTCMFLVASLAVGPMVTNKTTALERFPSAEQNSSDSEFITAEELKAKLDKKEPVTIVDVRGSSGSLESGNKIKGAVYVKLRRLKYRLGFPPLKDVPRNRDVVTYCACPNDESGIKAAQILREAGFKNVRVLKGGWVVWKKVNGQVEPMGRGM